MQNRLAEHLTTWKLWYAIPAAAAPLVASLLPPRPRPDTRPVGALHRRDRHGAAAGTTRRRVNRAASRPAAVDATDPIG